MPAGHQRQRQRRAGGGAARDGPRAWAPARQGRGAAESTPPEAAAADGGEAEPAAAAAAAAPAPVPLVVCGPSGVGKGTLIARLQANHPARFGFSCSHTTRRPREGEVVRAPAAPRPPLRSAPPLRPPAEAAGREGG